MKKNNIVFLLFLINISIYSNNNPSIGIASPYTINNNAATIFFNKQFTFELMSNIILDSYNFEVVITENIRNEILYYNQSKEFVIEKNYDYLFFSKVYTLEKFLFLKIVIVNPYSDEIIFSKLFKLKNDFNINETLSEVTKNIIKILDDLNLPQIKVKKIKVEKQEEKDDILLELQKKLKNEFYIQNGFLKTTPKVISFLNWYFGYNFSPFKFFDLGGGFFYGCGKIERKFNFSNINNEYFFIGTNTGISFFLPGFIVEPLIGVKLELCYVINKELDLYIPIDIGLRIYLRKENYLKINAVFQFTSFDIFKTDWHNNYLIGIYFGYAKKI